MQLFVNANKNYNHIFKIITPHLFDKFNVIITHKNNTQQNQMCKRITVQKNSGQINLLLKIN
jgi:hypothetical protein